MTGAHALSPRMIEVLRYAEAGRPLDTGCRAQSEYASRAGTILALSHRGLLCDTRITDAGRELLATVGKGRIGG